MENRYRARCRIRGASRPGKAHCTTEEITGPILMARKEDFRSHFSDGGCNQEDDDMTLSTDGKLELFFKHLRKAHHHAEMYHDPNNTRQCHVYHGLWTKRHFDAAAKLLEEIGEDNLKDKK
jgi:hypothetical protein